MNFLKTIGLLSLIFMTKSLYSQTISGKIMDSITKKPLELVNITLLKRDLGVYTNNDGDFKIKIDDNKDKLQVSSIGYNKKNIDLSNFNENKEYKLILFLSPKIEQLNEVKISNKKVSYSIVKTLGLVRKGKVRTGLPFGYEFCSVIKNPYHKKGKLHKVILSLNEMEKPDYLATYNIKFYEYDSENNSPGEEIYFENLIVQPENKTYKLKINVDSLSIPFPENGICIGVEIVNSKYNEPTKSMAHIAPKINFTHTDMDILTWNRFRNKKWRVDTHKSPFRKDFINGMINIEIKIEK